MTPVEVFLKRRPRDPQVRVRHHTVPLPPPRLSNDRPTLVVLEPSGYRAGCQEADSEKTWRKRSRARWLSPSGKASNPTVPL